MNEGAKNANDEMFRRAVSGNFATVINKLQRIIELLEAQAAQQSVQPTVATCFACGRELLPDSSCPNDDPSTRNSG